MVPPTHSPGGAEENQNKP